MAEGLPFLSTTSSFLSPLAFFSTEKQNTFVFSGSAVKILSWALAQCLLACSQGKSHETSVAKCSLIHMITIRLRTQPHLLLTYCYEANTFSFTVCFPLRGDVFNTAEGTHVRSRSAPPYGLCPVFVAGVTLSSLEQTAVWIYKSNKSFLPPKKKIITSAWNTTSQQKMPR